MAARIIDVHNHPNWHGHNVDDLVRNMDRHGIETTWLLSWEMPAAEFAACPGYHTVIDPRDLGMSLAAVVEGLRRHPDRFIGGWAPDPRDPHARSRLEAAVNLHGIRIYGELKCRMHYDTPDAVAMYQTCAELGLPVLFHLECPPVVTTRQRSSRTAWAEWYGGDLGTVQRVCTACPDTVFIGHGPGYWREISGDADASPEAYPRGPVEPDGRLLRVLRACPNLRCDLSAGSGANALRRDREHAVTFLNEFGDRILFGRDTFDGALHDLLLSLDLTADVLQNILSRNALSLLNSGHDGGTTT